ncbi:OmpA family protein [Asticcacaulis sp. BYS171W]|uniref:OmpA family protein n=1 Tax=Asticcacaulis aquaticus TaxID=2984212 RepID=A0ABT5HTV0_9CAUL|nr:OmpA family protein [Asticcacaulis aquaticus]MDC7683501.1 OmpA family protein [Asticcacaulis aquaticus]
MKHLKSRALIVALPLVLSLSACASHKYVDDKIATANGRMDQQDAHLGQLDQTTQEALNRATAAGKLAEGKFVYSVVLTDDSIKFDTGQAVLSETGKQTLAQLASRLKADNKNVYLEIQGYTDSTGTDAVNYRLGTDRADSVRRFLNGQGVALNRMASVSYGAEQPVAGNDTAQGRAANRRVVIVVLS